MPQSLIPAIIWTIPAESFESPSLLIKFEFLYLYYSITLNINRISYRKAYGRIKVCGRVYFLLSQPH